MREDVCCYGYLFQQGYGLKTNTLSTALFNNGYTYVAYFGILVVHILRYLSMISNGDQVCQQILPPNYSKPDGNWCGSPQKYFDLSMKMFTTITIYQAWSS